MQGLEEGPFKFFFLDPNMLLETIRLLQLDESADHDSLKARLYAGMHGSVRRKKEGGD